MYFNFIIFIFFFLQQSIYGLPQQNYDQSHNFQNRRNSSQYQHNHLENLHQQQQQQCKQNDSNYYFEKRVLLDNNQQQRQQKDFENNNQRQQFVYNNQQQRQQFGYNNQQQEKHKPKWTIKSQLLQQQMRAALNRKMMTKNAEKNHTQISNFNGF